MRKLLLGILMVILGIAGLSATLCGLAMFGWGDSGLWMSGVIIGVAPGLLMLWGARRLFNAI